MTLAPRSPLTLRQAGNGRLGFLARKLRLKLVGFPQCSEECCASESELSKIVASIGSDGNNNCTSVAFAKINLAVNEYYHAPASPRSTTKVSPTNTEFSDSVCGIELCQPAGEQKPIMGAWKSCSPSGLPLTPHSRGAVLTGKPHPRSRQRLPSARCAGGSAFPPAEPPKLCGERMKLRLGATTLTVHRAPFAARPVTRNGYARANGIHFDIGGVTWLGFDASTIRLRESDTEHPECIGGVLRSDLIAAEYFKRANPPTGASSEGRG